MSQANPPDSRTKQFTGAIETGEGHDVQGLHAPIMREKADPRDGFEPIPTWMVGVFGIIVFLGGVYLQRYSGDFRVDIYDERRPPIGAVTARQPMPIDPLVLGKRLYVTQGCVSCHQATGLGQPGAIPPLAKSEWVTGSPARLYRILLQGLQGEVKVLDASYNGNMPAFAAKLKDDQIAAVLSHIRHEWGNQAEPITTEAVAAAREATKDHSSPWTAMELLAIADEGKAEPVTKKRSDATIP